MKLNTTINEKICLMIGIVTIPIAILFIFRTVIYGESFPTFGAIVLTAGCILGARYGLRRRMFKIYKVIPKDNNDIMGRKEITIDGKRYVLQLMTSVFTREEAQTRVEHLRLGERNEEIQYLYM